MSSKIEDVIADHQRREKERKKRQGDGVYSSHSSFESPDNDSDDSNTD